MFYFPVWSFLSVPKVRLIQLHSKRLRETNCLTNFKWHEMWLSGKCDFWVSWFSGLHGFLDFIDAFLRSATSREMGLTRGKLTSWEMWLPRGTWLFGKCDFLHTNCDFSWVLNIWLKWTFLPIMAWSIVAAGIYRIFQKCRNVATASNCFVVLFCVIQGLLQSYVVVWM